MKGILALLVTLLLAATAAYYAVQRPEARQVRDLLAQLTVVEKERSQTHNSLLGYTKYTDYLSEGKKALEGQMKFLAAQVNREYTQVHHIQDSTLWIKSEATIILTYAVEYSFGFDLAPGRFAVAAAPGGILITLPKPDLVATPAVKLLSYDIPSSSLLIDEKQAVIALQQQTTAVAQGIAQKLKQDPAVVALCEQKLGEFLRDFLAKQPGVAAVPAIRFRYI